MHPRILDIQEAVCAHFDVPLREMRSGRRHSQIARPRQVAMYLARKLTVRSWPEIGRMFERDHSTVIHAWHKVTGLCASDASVSGAVAEIERDIARISADRVEASLAYWGA